MTPGKRLMYARQLTHISRTEFCKKSGLSHRSIAKWELDKKSFTLKNAKEVVEQLKHENIDISINWLLTGDGNAPKKIDSLQKRSKFETEQDLILDEIKEFERFHPNSITLQIYDDSCLPLYFPGDYMGGPSFQGEYIFTLKNQLCLVRLHNEVICVRKIVGYNPKKHTFDLRTVNPYTEISTTTLKDAKLIAAAPITFFRRVLS